MIKRAITVGLWAMFLFAGFSGLALLYIEAQGMNVDADGNQVPLWTAPVAVNIASGAFFLAVMVIAIDAVLQFLGRLLFGKKSTHDGAANPPPPAV